MTFSSDLVFDGFLNKPYHENDPVNPINIYGKSKANAEVSVMTENNESLIIRTSAFFGPWDKYNFVYQVLESLRGNNIFKAAEDIIISPTYIPDLVNVSLDLLIDNEVGIWHLSNHGEVSWAEFAINVAEKAHLNTNLIHPYPQISLGFVAERPSYSVLNSIKGVLMPTLENAIERYFEERKSFVESIIVK